MKRHLPFLIAGAILLATPMVPDLSEAAADGPKVVFGINTGNAVMGFSSDGDIVYPAPYYYGWCGQHRCHHRCRYVRPPHHHKKHHHKKDNRKKCRKQHKKSHHDNSRKHHKRHHDD